ncbi:MAG: hypothetical protein A2W35_05995 [Chloroflexi bacterium RBG_16_57_11]|nr:MAG: hypothetical protein A2W35_05995 [Chloroflexi bacterium RBG_16_57_11]
MDPNVFHSKHRWILIVSVVLFLLFMLLAVIFRNENANQPTDVTDWKGAYGAQYPYIEDYNELSSRGINLVVNNITTEPGEWERYYRAIVEQNLEIIPVLWGADQTAWTWNKEAEEWEIDINRYPNSRGAQFLQFLKEHPAFLEHTYAIYAFHEPFNPENPKLVSPSRIRKFWLQIHEEEFPNQRLLIYGESVSWNSACANGCVDFDAIGLYNFTKCGLGGFGKYRIIEAVPAKDGLLIRPGSCTSDRQRIIRAGEDLIDALYGFAQQSPPAPDGSRTSFFALIQTFAQSNPGLSYRMPRADEMYAWSTQIGLPQGNKLAGIQWYVFRFEGLYDQTLGDDRYDERGVDRWKTISDVADALYGVQGQRQ